MKREGKEGKEGREREKREQRKEGKEKDKGGKREKKVKTVMSYSGYGVVYLLVVRFPSGPMLKSNSSFCTPSDILTNSTSALIPSSASSNYIHGNKFS